MNFIVPLKVFHSFVRLGTEFTFMASYFLVCLHMLPQYNRSGECLFAHVTLVWPFAGMGPHVDSHVLYILESEKLNTTLKR